MLPSRLSEMSTGVYGYSPRPLHENPEMNFLADVPVEMGYITNCLFNQDCTVLSGRVRGKVSFTRSRNTPFSGLAADGAKLAMWELLKAGFDLHAFVHDEIVLSVPIDDQLDARVAEAKDLCISAMKRVIPTIPVKCTVSVARHWSKQTVLETDPEGHIVVTD